MKEKLISKRYNRNQHDLGKVSNRWDYLNRVFASNIIIYRFLLGGAIDFWFSQVISICISQISSCRLGRNVYNSLGISSIMMLDALAASTCFSSSTTPRNIMCSRLGNGVEKRHVWNECKRHMGQFRNAKTKHIDVYWTG